MKQSRLHPTAVKRERPERSSGRASRFFDARTGTDCVPVTMQTVLATACVAVVVTGVITAGTAQAATFSSAPFGTTEGGKPVSLYTMTSAHGVVVKFMSYGGALTEILAPDRKGDAADIILGLPTLADYLKLGAASPFLGVLVGRYANRIAKGHFSLDGKDYTLAINNPPNALHGGLQGFDKQVWTVEPTTTSGDAVSARLALTSPDGDQGYPGTLQVTVTYTLSDDNAFTITYQATTDKDTVLNLTNHAYFNLAGVGAPEGVYPQVLTINADTYLPTDAGAIPLGAPEVVAGTPFDFRKPTSIGAYIRSNNQQLLMAHGYDHNWVLNKTGDRSQPQFAARLVDPVSGRTLECLTDQPGIQVYTSNFMTGALAGVGGIYRQTDAVTMETQHYPDSPNHPDYPTTELKPGETFHSTTIFRFGVVH
jgi:aldose 1-epimerase